MRKERATDKNTLGLAEVVHDGRVPLQSIGFSLRRQPSDGAAGGAGQSRTWSTASGYWSSSSRLVSELMTTRAAYAFMRQPFPLAELGGRNRCFPALCTLLRASF